MQQLLRLTPSLAASKATPAPRPLLPRSARVPALQPNERCNAAEPGPGSWMSSRRSSVRAHHRIITRALADDDVVRVAAVGDLVTIHYTLADSTGKVLESSRAVEEPLVFEVGAGDMMGNKLFQGFDEAVRGLAVGQATELEAMGPEWNRDLLFKVPENHPEIERLQGRYKNHGGLKEGLVVELANNNMAMVVGMKDGMVAIDANPMLAGQKLLFTLEVVSIEKQPASS